ncbi:MAG: response regulator [Balneolaceae bacterium]
MSTAKNICIIDDDKVYTFGVKKIIKNHLPQNKVTSYENGRIALEGIQKAFDENLPLPDYILLDIDMPELNGWGFLKEFEELRGKMDKKIEIFVISSRVENNTHLLFKMEWDDKVSDFIRKPVNVERLKEILV